MKLTYSPHKNLQILYGRINPIGFWASFTATLEALVGLMSFTLVTDLLYSRFAKPKAFIKYSKNALIAPFKDQVAIMFRMVPYTNNYLMNVEVRMTLAIKILENRQRKNKFFNLDLDVAKATTMTTNLTLVHIINEESLFYPLSKEDIIASEAELLIFVQFF